MSVNAGNQKNRSNTTPVLLICGILTMMAITPLLSGVNADSGSPDWQVGDSWALGYEEDLDFNFDYEELLKSIAGDELDMEESELEDLTVTSDGIAGMYIISEVMETSPQYKIKTTTSFGLDWDITLKVTGQFPKTGHFEDVTEGEDGNWDVPKERRTMTLIIDCEAALLATGFEYRDTGSLAIVKQTYSMETASKATMEAKDWLQEDEGEWDYDYETDEETLETLDITYNDFSIEYSWDAEAEVKATYSPGIESLPPSDEIGDIWNLTYSVTTSGDYDGYFKVSLDGDLPDMNENDFMNYQRFDLQDPMWSSPPFVEGEIEETTETVTLRQEIVGKEYVTMADGTSTECIVYKEHDIEDDYDGGSGYDDDEDESSYDDEAASTFYFYSPEYHRIVRFQTEYLTEDEIYSEIPYSSVNMTPVAVNQAKEFNKNHANPSAVGSSENGSTNYFFILGIVIVISIVGIGANTTMKKRSQGVDTGYTGVPNGPFQAGQAMGQGYQQAPGTFQHPIQPGYAAGYQTGQGQMNQYHQQYPQLQQQYPQQQQNPQQQQYPQQQQKPQQWGHTPVQQPYQQPQSQQYQQPRSQQYQQPEVQKQSFAPQSNQGQYQQVQSAQQRSITATIQQQHMMAQPTGQSRSFCRECGNSLVYVSQYNRNFCMKCQIYR